MEPLKHFGVSVKEGSAHESAVYGLAYAYALIEKRISDYLCSFDLTPAKFNALMVIKHKGKESGLSQIEIGRDLIVTASNMTRLLDRLYKKGLIERSAQAGDRRVNLIKISKNGSMILDRAWPGYCRRIKELAQLLNQEELKKAAFLIVKWCAKLQETS